MNIIIEKEKELISKIGAPIFESGDSKIDLSEFDFSFEDTDYTAEIGTLNSIVFVSDDSGKDKKYIIFNRSEDGKITVEFI